MEPFSYGARGYAPLRMRANGRVEDVTTKSAGVSLQLGGD